MGPAIATAVFVAGPGHSRRELMTLVKERNKGSTHGEPLGSGGRKQTPNYKSKKIEDDI